MINAARIGFDPAKSQIIIFIPGPKPNSAREAKPATDDAVRAVARLAIKAGPLNVVIDDQVFELSIAGQKPVEKKDDQPAIPVVADTEPKPDEAKLAEHEIAHIPFFKLKKMAKDAGIDVATVDKKEWPRLILEKQKPADA